MKKLVFSLLVLSLICLPLAGAVSRVSAAEWPEPAPAADFAFNRDTRLITAYTGSAESLVIPAEIDGVQVLGLDVAALQNNTSLQRVKVSEGIRLIEANAFYFLDKLSEVSLPQSLEVIGDYAFFQTALTDVTLPPAVFYVGSHAFDITTGFQSLTFTGDVPAFGRDVVIFSDGLPAIKAPAELTDAYAAALGHTVEAAGASAAVARIADPAAFELSEDGQITGYTGADLYLDIPAEIDGKAVTGIGENAFFAHATLRGVSLPASVTTIGKSAFASGKLLSLTLPEGLTTIGDDAFFGCPIVNLQLPDSVSAIGNKAFYGVRAMSVALPAGLSEIAAQTFGNSRLNDVFIPAGVTSIGSEAFKGSTELSYLIFGGPDLPQFDASAFAECPLADIDLAWDAPKSAETLAKEVLTANGYDAATINVWRANNPSAPPYPSADNVLDFDGATGLVTGFQGPATEIAMYWDAWSDFNNREKPLTIVGLGPRVFENSAVTSFYVPRSNQFTTIGDYAFASSQLATIDLFDSVTEIGEGAFENCAALTSLTLPYSGVKIGRNAFAGSGLTELVLPAGTTVDGPIGLDPAAIRVAADATDEQIKALADALEYPWYLDLLRVGETGGYVKMPAELTAAPAEDFVFEAETGTVTAYNGNDTTIVVPSEIGGTPVRSIGNMAFNAADDGDITLILPESVTEIQDTAFTMWPHVVRIEAYGPLESVGIRAFETTEKLAAVILHNGVKSLGIYAFQETPALQEVRLGSKLAELPEGCFMKSGLAGTVILEHDTIGSAALNECRNVEAIVVTDQVKSIGDGAFQNMPGLKTITFEKADATVLGEFTYPFSADMTGFELIVPADASDEEVAAFVTKLEQSMVPDAADRVKRGEPK